MTNRPEDGYAVLRVDAVDELSPSRLWVEPGSFVTVKEVLATQEEAEREVERLTALNADKGCLYFWQFTRVFREGRGMRVGY